MKPSNFATLICYIYCACRVLTTFASECDSFGVCSQKCELVGSQVLCSCTDGFKLKGNTSCIPNDPGFKLLYDNQYGIFSMASPDYKTTAITNSMGKDAVGFTVDIRNNFVYWTDSRDQRQAVRRISLDLDGTPDSVVVDVGLFTPDKIAFDWITGNSYFTDYHLRHIAVCALSPTKCAVIIKGRKGHTMGNIALHPNLGLMFWFELGNMPSIMKAKMDGSTSTSIASITSLASGLSVDEANSRLYWVNMDGFKIESARMDGSDRRVITAEREFPVGIDIYGDRIYWSEHIDNNIMVADKFTGQVEAMHLTTSFSIITSLFVMNVAKQPQLRANPCENLNCSYLCVISEPGAICLCPVGMEKNGSTCSEDDKQPRLLLAQGGTLLSMAVNAVGKDVFNEISLPSEIKVVTALVYNPINKSVIIYDGESQSIFEFHKNTNEYQILIENDLENVTSMDIDLVDENLIWIDMVKETMEVLSLRTRYRSVVRRNMENIHDILFSSDLGLLYMSMGRDSENGKIYETSLGNHNSNATLFSNDSSLLSPVVMTYDQETGGAVVLQETGFAVIFQGSDGIQYRKVYNFPTTYKQLDLVFGIVKIKNTIFWTDIQTNAIKAMNIDQEQNKSVMSLIAVNINTTDPSSPIQKIKLAPMINDIGYLDNRRKEHECSPSNPTRKVCAQICLPVSSGNGGACWCTQGYHLGKDGLSCNEDQDSNPNLVFWLCVFVVVAMMKIVPRVD